MGGYCEQHQWRYEDCAKRQCQKNLKRLIGELHSMSVKGIAVSVSDCGKKKQSKGASTRPLTQQAKQILCKNCYLSIQIIEVELYYRVIKVIQGKNREQTRLLISSQGIFDFQKIAIFCNYPFTGLYHFMANSANVEHFKVKSTVYQQTSRSFSGHLGDNH